MCVERDLQGMRSVGGERGVKYKFINKDLKRATKLHGKLCYLTEPIKEDYFKWLLKLSGIVNLIDSI